jgi:DNA-binding response OmpR family regulator
MTKKILIVEDEETILELLLATFGDLMDYKILCAGDGEEALRIARVDNPDIILLDILLPKINGYEVCKSVKSDPTISHIKVLMLSGMVQSSGWQKAQEVGADAYIAKPFSSIALVEKVEELLRSNSWG